MAKKRRQSAPEKPSEILIPSGSTMLNLCCTDREYGAFVPGTIITMPGGSQSGKTILMLTMLAAVNANKVFDDYDLIYDDGEESLHFDMESLFSSTLRDRIIPPRSFDDGDPAHSETIQEFQANLINRCDKDSSPFIYILDSLDALASDEEIEREMRRAIAMAKNPEAVKEIKGSYNAEKAKRVGQTLRIINNHIKRTASLLCIIQQERDNLGAIGPFSQKNRTSGGRAPFFYSFHQVWLTKAKAISKTSRGIKRETGNTVIAKVKKNKFNGKRRQCEFSVYNDYGVDDISSCISFLIQAKEWKKSGQNINSEFGKMSLRKLIAHIESKRKYIQKLQAICGNVWREIEKSVKSGRKRRF
jgi:RecA/RadA recombinase